MATDLPGSTPGESIRREHVSTEKTIQERVAAFPPVFQERIYGLRKAGKGFNSENEGYEVFCCEQAIAIAKSLKTKEKVYEFAELTFQEQVALVPDLSDDHSGNTFKTACDLAIFYIETPAIVPRAHGALCSLSSCQAYGCYAGRQRFRSTSERNGLFLGAVVIGMDSGADTEEQGIVARTVIVRDSNDEMIYGITTAESDFRRIERWVNKDGISVHYIPGPQDLSYLLSKYCIAREFDLGERYKGDLFEIDLEDEECGCGNPMCGKEEEEEEDAPLEQVVPEIQPPPGGFVQGTKFQSERFGELEVEASISTSSTTRFLIRAIFHGEKFATWVEENGVGVPKDESYELHKTLRLLKIAEAEGKKAN